MLRIPGNGLIRPLFKPRANLAIDVQIKRADPVFSAKTGIILHDDPGPEHIAFLIAECKGVQAVAVFVVQGDAEFSGRLPRPRHTAQKYNPCHFEQNTLPPHGHFPHVQSSFAGRAFSSFPKRLAVLNISSIFRKKRKR